jgi:hypothetical protein
VRKENKGSGYEGLGGASLKAMKTPTPTQVTWRGRQMELAQLEPQDDRNVVLQLSRTYDTRKARFQEANSDHKRT